MLAVDLQFNNMEIEGDRGGQATRVHHGSGTAGSGTAAASAPSPASPHETLCAGDQRCGAFAGQHDLQSHGSERFLQQYKPWANSHNTKNLR